MNTRTLCLLAGALLLAPGAWAQNAGPVGLWKSVDDVSGKPRALVRISESNGEFIGKIEKLFVDKNADPAPLCTPCKGSKKDQAVIGMTILEGLTFDGAAYSGGKLLDPEMGTVYKGKVTMLENGKKLSMRGYVGLPMFGRSQTWIRQE